MIGTQTGQQHLVAGGVRAAVKAKMVVRAQRRAELPEQVALPQQMQQRAKEVCGELEQRSRGSGGSWWEPGQS